MRRPVQSLWVIYNLLADTESNKLNKNNSLMLVTEFWLNIQRAVELRDFCHRAYEHEVRNVRRVKLHTFPLKQA